MELVIEKKPVDECDIRRAARQILRLCKEYMETEEGKAEFEAWKAKQAQQEKRT